MPIFEYRCSACGRRFEKIVLKSSEKIECPACGAAEPEPLLSTFAVTAPAQTGSGVSEQGPCPCGAPRRGMCGS